MSGTLAPEHWRGVAAEEADERPPSIRGFLRGRSRRLLSSLLRPRRRPLTVAAAVIVFETLARLGGPVLVKMGIDRGIPAIRQDGRLGPLVAIVAVFGVVVIVRAVLEYAFLSVMGRLAQDVLFDLRKRLFDHFQRLSLSFHDRYTSGRVISRLTSDVEAIWELLGSGMLEVAGGGLSIFGITLLLLVLDWQLALVALAVFPFVLLLTRWFRSRAEEVYRETREAVALVIVHFVESLGGIRAVQAFRREARNEEIFQDLDGRLLDANLRSNRLAAIYGPGVTAMGRATLALVLLIGSYRVVGGQMTLGTLAAFMLYVRRFFEPVQDLSQFYNLFQSAAAALEKLSGVLEERPAVAEPDRPVGLSEVRGEVRLDGVRFAYRSEEVLHGVDLLIPAGQTIAVVGPTGAGKSTLVRLVARFYDPTEGRVLLDGVDVRQLSDDTLRRAVVMVTQESFLFSGSVADNIAFGRPTATRAEVEEAARVIGADAFIAAMPDGYDTDVRKRGGRLSAGQRQLVAFARAFLADPRVLILDEATSSLDIPSERLVQRALRTLLAERTAIIIAHRLSTVEIADRVLVVEAGEVVEDGPPSELMNSASSRYGVLHQAWVDSLR
ncbi:MAG: ABC transporter ATP-binding protein/permease [Actinobacteria bacterium]|nr:ABC transporter ATP-binding protein/permease [Actinomycetota bacterium]